MINKKFKLNQWYKFIYENINVYIKLFLYINKYYECLNYIMTKFKAWKYVKTLLDKNI